MATPKKKATAQTEEPEKLTVYHITRREAHEILVGANIIDEGVEQDDEKPVTLESGKLRVAQVEQAEVHPALAKVALHFNKWLPNADSITTIPLTGDEYAYLEYDLDKA